MGALASPSVDRRSGRALKKVSITDQNRTRRSQRAKALLGERPHAESLLRFYLALLELQALVCDPAAVERWGEAVILPEGEGGRLRFEQLPLDQLTSRFDKFCRALPRSAPEPILRAAAVVSAGREQVRSDLLAAVLNGEDLTAEARKLDCDPAPLAFLPRGFLQPIAEAVSGRLGGVNDSVRTPTCPRCGWSPQVSVLADESETQGTRRLICAFCANEWLFPRSVCPGCETTGEEGLDIHVDDGDVRYVRVETCRTCRRYLKSVDLRVVGLAVPLVDDLATPELDLWATDQGFEKITPNVLGI